MKNVTLHFDPRTNETNKYVIGSNNLNISLNKKIFNLTIITFF